MLLNSSTAGTAEQGVLGAIAGDGIFAPYFQANSISTPVAVDIISNGATDYSTKRGVAWYDICSAYSGSGVNYECLTMSKGNTNYGGAAQISVTSGGTGTAVRPLLLQTQGGSVILGGGTSFTTPDAKLDLLTTDVTDASLGAGAVNLRILTTDSAAVGYGGTISLGGSYTGTTTYGLAALRGGLETVGQASGYLGMYTTKQGTGPVERMRVTSGGLVTFGGITTSYVAVNPASATFAIRLADNSADAPITSSTQTLSAAAPTVSAGQIGYGATTAAASNCGSLTGAAGCVVLNIAGTTHYLPYY
jgi:hypothetical protein